MLTLMQNFQVIHDGNTYLVEGGDAESLRTRFAEAIRAGGDYVTFDVALDYDSDGPVSVFVSAQSPATIVIV